MRRQDESAGLANAVPRYQPFSLLPRLGRESKGEKMRGPESQREAIWKPQDDQTNQMHFRKLGPGSLDISRDYFVTALTDTHTWHNAKQNVPVKNSPGISQQEFIN